jgi:hypothetical protein
MKKMILVVATLLIGFFAYAETVAEYSKEKKAQIEKEMNDGLEAAQKQIDALKAKMKNTKGQIKSDMEAQISNLEKDQVAVKARLMKMKEATGSAWSEIQSGTKEAFMKLKESVNKAAAKFKE